MENENDELRYRFTAWLTTLVRRAKINYLEKEKKHKNNVPLDSVAEIKLPENPKHIETEKAEKIEFSDERIEKSFSTLSSTRQKILTMVYLKGMTSEEIAKELGCSIQNVFKVSKKKINKF